MRPTKSLRSRDLMRSDRKRLQGMNGPRPASLLWQPDLRVLGRASSPKLRFTMILGSTCVHGCTSPVKAGTARKTKGGSPGGLRPPWQKMVCRALELRCAPAGGSGFLFGAEPAFALRGVDSGFGVPGALGRVVHFFALGGDVAFDLAVARRDGLHRRGGFGGGGLCVMLAVAASPVPRVVERTGPNAALGLPGVGLVAHIVLGVGAIGQRVALLHHPCVEIGAPQLAHGHDAPVAVLVLLFAGDCAMPDEVVQRQRG